MTPYALDPIHDIPEKPLPQRSHVPKTPSPLAGETIWYQDPDRKQLHSELVRDGMERARQSGKHIGRPRVIDKPGFAERFDAALDRINAGELSRSQAADELQIGYSTLMRLLDACIVQAKAD